MSKIITIITKVVSQQKPQQTKSQAQQKQQESVSFFDEKWSGHQIAKLTGDNAFTDWLQNKDKVCTDGKDDGNIGLWEGVKSFGKGLIGGIPKAMINHPVASAIAIGAGSIATAVAGSAILVPMTALGLVAGVGMAGYGAYKAATAKTDGEAKEALETCGMGVTTAALSTASAGKVLDAAAKEGVQSAQLSEDAGTFTKVKTLFKATPEALKVSGHNAKNTYTMFRFNEKTLLDGTKQKYYEGKVYQEIKPDGTTINYEGKYSKTNTWDLLTDEKVLMKEQSNQKELEMIQSELSRRGYLTNENGQHYVTYLEKEPAFARGLNYADLVNEFESKGWKLEYIVNSDHETTYEFRNGSDIVRVERCGYYNETELAKDRMI